MSRKSHFVLFSFFTMFCSRLIFSDKGAISQMEEDTGAAFHAESINDDEKNSSSPSIKLSVHSAPCEASALMQLCSSLALRRTAAVNNKQRRGRKNMCRVGATRFSRGEKRDDSRAIVNTHSKRNLIERIADTNFVLVIPQCNYGCPRVYIGGEYVKDA